MILWENNWITTFLIFVVTYLLVYYAVRKPKGIPPGPALFPVIGNLLSLAGDLLKNLETLRLKYGDIYSLYLGNEHTVFLNGYDVIHDALVKNGSKFMQRPYSSFDRLVVKYPGIVFSNGRLWKEQRNFATMAFNEIYFKHGGENVEAIVKREISHLVTKLNELETPADVGLYITVSFSNVMFYTSYKHRFDFEDDRVKRFLSLVREGADEFTKTHVLVNCFPFLSKLPFDFLGIKRTLARFLTILKMVRPFVNKLKTNHTKDKRDTLVDLYMNAMEELAHSDDAQTFTAEQLEITIYDLLLAGSETSANTLRWLLLYFIHYPHVQAKVYDEIRTKLGGTTPCLSDRKRLPYTQAAILEALRISTVAPLAVPHSVTQDLLFHGYLLPKGCTVMANIHSSNNDPRVWSNPQEFKPERFLANNETELDIPKQFIPFSLGQRSCLGETLAKVELFLFVTTLVQNFEFLPAVDGEMPSFQGVLGLTWSPKPYKVRLVKRNSL